MALQVEEEATAKDTGGPWRSEMMKKEVHSQSQRKEAASSPSRFWPHQSPDQLDNTVRGQ